MDDSLNGAVDLSDPRDVAILSAWLDGARSERIVSQDRYGQETGVLAPSRLRDMGLSHGRFHFQSDEKRYPQTVKLNDGIKRHWPVQFETVLREQVNAAIEDGGQFNAKAIEEEAREEAGLRTLALALADLGPEDHDDRKHPPLRALLGDETFAQLAQSGRRRLRKDIPAQELVSAEDYYAALAFADIESADKRPHYARFPQERFAHHLRELVQQRLASAGATNDPEKAAVREMVHASDVGTMRYHQRVVSPTEFELWAKGPHDIAPKRFNTEEPGAIAAASEHKQKLTGAIDRYNFALHTRRYEQLQQHTERFARSITSEGAPVSDALMEARVTAPVAVELDAQSALSII